MGTHPIFESDFDCLTDWAARSAFRKQKMTRVGRSDILDKYEMMGVVGEGSYGTVHRARNRENGISVAIKKFIEDDSNTLKIAQRELRALRRLRHENLVNMIEHTRKRRRLYIIFEYVDGTVLDFLESQPSKRIEPGVTREIIWQVLRALEFIHQHGMIHRDVKPELLSSAEYLHESDFQRAKTELVERIRHANLPTKALLKVSKSSSEYKFKSSSSTSKLHQALKNQSS